MSGHAEKPNLHLASGSPRRREILGQLGLRFSFAETAVDESRLAGEGAADMVMRLAEAKAAAGERSNADAAILAADTVVVLDNRVFGKPASREDAVSTLVALSGRTHEVLTAVVLRRGHDVFRALSRSEVSFREIGVAEANGYWDCGEPRDKAGSYAIQGVGGIFVKQMRGSFSGIVGLPVFETASLLSEAGIDILTRK